MLREESDYNDFICYHEGGNYYMKRYVMFA